MIKFKDFVQLCDSELIIVLWSPDDTYLGEFSSKYVDEGWNGLYGEWFVDKILGSGKGHLIDVILKEA